MKFKRYWLSATEVLTKAERTDRMCWEIRKMYDFYFFLHQKENQDIYLKKKGKKSSSDVDPSPLRLSKLCSVEIPRGFCQFSLDLETNT